MADRRFARSLDVAPVERLALEHAVLVTVGEGAAGGFGSLVMDRLAWRGMLDSGVKFRPMTLPDRLIDHNSQAKQHDEAGLDAPHVVDTALAVPGNDVVLSKPSLAWTI